MGPIKSKIPQSIFLVYMVILDHVYHDTIWYLWVCEWQVLIIDDSKNWSNWNQKPKFPQVSVFGIQLRNQEASNKRAQRHIISKGWRQQEPGAIFDSAPVAKRQAATVSLFHHRVTHDDFLLQLLQFDYVWLSSSEKPRFVFDMLKKLCSETLKVPNDPKWGIWDHTTHLEGQKLTDL